MEKRIANLILRMLFYRNDIIKKIDFKNLLIKFPLDESFQFDDEKSLKQASFLAILKQHDLIQVPPKPLKTGATGHSFSFDEDDVDKLKQEIASGQIQISSTYGTELFDKSLRIPILYLCIMKHQISCFKFLLLNGADPFTRINPTVYNWDSRGIGSAFGETEILKILDERGARFDVQILEGYGLTYRNKSLFQLLNHHLKTLNQEQLTQCLSYLIQSNNMKGVTYLLSNARINGDVVT